MFLDPGQQVGQVSYKVKSRNNIHAFSSQFTFTDKMYSFFTCNSIPFWLINIEVRVRESSKPFGFLVGPHIYKLVNFRYRGETRKERNIYIVNLQTNKPNYNYIAK